MRKILLALLAITLVAGIALGGKDRREEKRAEARAEAAAYLSSQLPGLAKTQATWDSLKIKNLQIEFLTVNALPGNVIWISGYIGYGISGADYDISLLSTNGGTTWTLDTLEFTLGNGVFVVGRDDKKAVAADWNGAIYRTTNGGTSWAKVYEYGGGAGFFDGIVGAGSDTLVAVGDADVDGLAVVKSTDGGATWTRFTNLPATEKTSGLYISSASYAQPLDIVGPNIYITTYVSSGTSPRLVKSTDFGANWTSADLALTGGNTVAYSVRSINMVDKNIGWIVPRASVGTTGRSWVHKTTDGGATWSDTLLVERGSVVKTVKPVRGTNSLLALGYNGNNPRAWWSTNGGGSWIAISPAYGGLAGGEDFTNASFINATSCYAVGIQKSMKLSNPVSSVKADPSSSVPNEFTLQQNYPNPFNPSTSIRYSIPEQSVVTLKVFTLLGEEVATLINGEIQSRGSYVAQFDAGTLATGIYIYRLEAGQSVNVKKMVLVK